MQHLPIARTSLLALLLATATSPAAAVVIGEPDNSLIMHYFGVSASAPNKYVEFSDYDSPAISVSGAGAFATVQDQFGVTYFGGSNTWTMEASLAEGIMRASVTASTGTRCDVFGNCLPDPRFGQVLLTLRDRVYIDEEIANPTSATARLAVDGHITGPVDGGIVATSSVRAFVDGTFDAPVVDYFVTETRGSSEFLLEDAVALLPGQQWFDIEMSLHLIVNSSWLNSGALTSIDFGHTALLDIILPDGLTFHTEGGFTGRTAVAAPEPASLALFGVGLLGLAMLRRRHHPTVDQTK